VYLPIQGPRPHSLGNSAKAIATRKLHLRLLRLVQDRMAEQMLHDCPLPQAIEYVMLREAVEHDWHATTLSRYLAALQGAFTDLPLYSKELWSINLQSDPFYRAAIKAADAAARSAIPSRVIMAMTKDDVVAILAQEHDPTIRSMLILAWVTAGRLGDVAQLAAADVRVKETVDGTTPCSITFRRGKTIPKRGPYTVDTLLSPQWAEEVKAFLATRTLSDRIFSETASPGGVVASATAAIRRARPNLEARSLRRGSLQTMATNNAKLEALLLYSGHKSVTTLYRYLNWGQVQSGTAAEAAVHAAALLPGSPQ
jgi:integrase